MNTVRNLEQQLFAAFPAENACNGDRIGLLVGNEGAEIQGIALALDAKVADIEEAAARGCNVLVTHHPVYWYPPTTFLREGPSAGASIYRAAELGMSLIAMHTNLDCAPAAREMLLAPAGFVFAAPLALPEESDDEMSTPGTTIETHEQSEVFGNNPLPAFGQLGKPQDGKSVSLRDVATRYRESFGAVAKVWGDPNKSLSRLAACSGGGGVLVQRAINTGADCYVTGEVAYHEALELAAAGVALIELGHDRSELPYRYYLKEALVAAGFDESMLHILEPTVSWWQ